LIPVQISYVAFLATAIVMLLMILRPPMASPSYYFSMAILLIASAVSFVEARRARKQKNLGQSVFQKSFVYVGTWLGDER
jgi:hypothetical protein